MLNTQHCQPKIFLHHLVKGALAIVCRADDDKTISMLKKIEDKKSRTEIEAERALSEYVESGCRFPVGALAIANSNMLKLTVSAYSVDGKKSITVEKTGDIDKPKEVWGQKSWRGTTKNLALQRLLLIGEKAWMSGTKNDWEGISCWRWSWRSKSYYITCG